MTLATEATPVPQLLILTQGMGVIPIANAKVDTLASSSLGSVVLLQFALGVQQKAVPSPYKEEAAGIVVYSIDARPNVVRQFILDEGSLQITQRRLDEYSLQEGMIVDFLAKPGIKGLILKKYLPSLNLLHCAWAVTTLTCLNKAGVEVLTITILAGTKELVAKAAVHTT